MSVKGEGGRAIPVKIAHEPEYSGGICGIIITRVSTYNDGAAVVGVLVVGAVVGRTVVQVTVPAG